MKELDQAALTIGGSDSCAGAGIQADLKSFQAFGVYGASVVTAVTAQNTLQVSTSQVLPVELVNAQLQAVLLDLPIKAIKTGMLASAEIVLNLATELSSKTNIPLLVDPVLQATTGASLASNDTGTAMLEALLPLAELVTPNLSEVQLLTGIKVHDPNSMVEAGLRLLETGCTAVLIKGGHLLTSNQTEVQDLLLDSSGQHWFKQHRHPGEFHGTGCTLAAAICAGRARGLNLLDAVEQGINYVQQCIGNASRSQQGDIALLDHRQANFQP